MTFKLREVAGDYSMAGTRRAEAPGNIRVGYFIKGDRAPHLDDSSTPSESLPKAVAVYVRRGNAVLAVTRRGDPSDLNMPGGGVEPGEDPRDAAARELWEETGIKADRLFPVFTRVNDGHLVTVYKVDSFHGDLKSSREGEASWQDPSRLAAGSYGDFFNDMCQTLVGDALNESRRTR